MRQTETLKQNHEFRRLYSKGLSSVAPTLVIYCKPNKGPQNRLGYTVTVKLGHAVVRNHIRRRLREIVRLHKNDVKQGYDIVIVARSKSVDATYAELDRDFLLACEKLGLLKEGRP